MVGESALCYPLLVIFVAVAGDGPGRVPAAGAGHVLQVAQPGD